MAASVKIGDIVNVWPTGKHYLVSDVSGSCFIGVRFGESIMLTKDLCFVSIEAKNVTEKMAIALKNRPKSFWQRLFAWLKK